MSIAVQNASVSCSPSCTFCLTEGLALPVWPLCNVAQGCLFAQRRRNIECNILFTQPVEWMIVQNKVKTDEEVLDLEFCSWWFLYCFGFWHHQYRFLRLGMIKKTRKWKRKTAVCDTFHPSDQLYHSTTKIFQHSSQKKIWGSFSRCLANCTALNAVCYGNSKRWSPMPTLTLLLEKTKKWDTGTGWAMAATVGIVWCLHFALNTVALFQLQCPSLTIRRL